MGVSVASLALYFCFLSGLGNECFFAAPALAWALDPAQVTLRPFGDPFQKQVVSFETCADKCSLLIIEVNPANYSCQAREADERSVYTGSDSNSHSSPLPDYCH